MYLIVAAVLCEFGLNSVFLSIISLLILGNYVVNLKVYSIYQNILHFQPDSYNFHIMLTTLGRFEQMVVIFYR